MFRRKRVIVLIIFITIINFIKADFPKPKYILYWSALEIPDYFKNCSVSNCIVTRNRDLLDIEKFDAILFFGGTLDFKLYGKPSRRSPHQVYVYVNHEPPAHTFIFGQKLENFFNWSMTYRLDSDVVATYGRLIKEEINYEAPTLESIKRRRKKIAWFVSDCSTVGFRNLFKDALNNYIPVDVYGMCGNLRCPKSSKTQCYRMIEENYKFYLSFENSVCEDYVTEKLFNILKLNVIPIVYGGANYEKFAPPHSVIDVMKFPDTHSLAAYMKQLDENVTAYLEYFKWKTDYRVDTTLEQTMCNLCEKLNEPLMEKHIDVYKWSSMDQCQMAPLKLLG